LGRGSTDVGWDGYWDGYWGKHEGIPGDGGGGVLTLR
jgi:hypothetical protein